MTSRRPAGSSRSPGPDAPAGPLADARAILFDFDGPVTRFFDGYPTEPIADEIKILLRERGVPLPATVLDTHDPHRILQLLRSDVFRDGTPGHEDQKTLELAEAVVTDHEYRAVADAPLDEHIESLLTTLRRLGKRLVVVSNNAEGPVRAHLERQHLDTRFERVFGRDPLELRHLKPDPHCVLRALDHLGAAPRECLLIGDQLTDLAAADAVGMPFLGYARSAAEAAQMWREGAVWAGASLAPLRRAADGLLCRN
ncbi:HAD family phosphatase [Streptomyces sp. NPDC046465]|uniref:HAD family hydrolase n=1 Tax=Streptomyces sp. NPDC046465 TaxID=3155810 RepID=UPI0033DD0A63